jgi:hypothetical protein
MRITEVEQYDDGKLLALMQFLLGRAKDTNAQKKISTQSLINLAHNVGLTLTVDSLIDLSQRPPLNKIIKNVSNAEVQFRGAEDSQSANDQEDAEKTVEKMAKRALTR